MPQGGACKTAFLCRNRLILENSPKTANPPASAGPLAPSGRHGEVQRAGAARPQRRATLITVHGRGEAVAAADEFRRLKGKRTGEALIAAMRASPFREIGVEPERARLPVREAGL